MTNVGVGSSKKRNAKAAGHEAATSALAQLGGAAPMMVLAFANYGYNQATLLEAIREVAGPDAQISGCSSEGVIFPGGCDESPNAVSVMMMASETIVATAINVPAFSSDASAVGRALAARIAEIGPDRAKAVFLFPDGVSGNHTEMLRAMQHALAFPIKIAGGAAGDSFKADPGHVFKTYQYCGDQVTSDSVSALVLGGDVELEIAVSHGCTPLGLPREVTKVDGPWVHEVEGRPAWAVFKEYLVGDPADLLFADTVHLCVGEPLDDRQREAYGSDYVIRTPIMVSEDKKSLYFSGGLQLGTRVQITRRDAKIVAANARESAAGLSRRRSASPAAVFQFDCAGRGYMLFGDNASEVAVKPLQEELGGSVPWVGFHTFGEIAPIGPDTFFHNYTVVLCAIYG